LKLYKTFNHKTEFYLRSNLGGKSWDVKTFFVRRGAGS